MFNGLWTDGEPEAQPQGTYRMAVNAIKEPSEQALATEPSTKFITELGDDLVGSIPMDGEQVILFAQPGLIYLYDQRINKLTTLVDRPELNFSTDHKIQGRYKVVNGCERSIYWNDGYNEDRYLNIDKLSNFNSLEDFRLLPVANYPTVLTTVRDGGVLKKGMYMFVLEFMDSSRNILLKTIPSTPVYVYDENKNIGLEVKFVDTDTKFIRLSVISYTAKNGTTLQGYEYEDLIPVTSNIFLWTYTGASVIEKDWRSLVSGLQYFDTSRYMEVVHGRLLRGNISEKAYEYSKFQQAASKICTKYTIKETTDNIFTEPGGEVKAYGIVYLFKNGSLSPVFHIPGRSRRPSDEVIATSPINNSVVSRWKFEDTSIKAESKLGYYESNELYTNPANYCGTDSYWGVDCDGKSLNNTPVRYHRIPTRYAEPLVSTSTVTQAEERVVIKKKNTTNKVYTSVTTPKRYIGVKFTGITYPDPDIVGHFFVSAKADTVVSSGYMLPWNQDAKDEGRFIHYLPNANDKFEKFTNSKIQNIITPATLVDKVKVTGTHVYVNGDIEAEHYQKRPFYNKFFIDNTDLQLYDKQHYFGINKPFNSREELLKINDSELVLYSSKKDEYINRSLHTSMNVLELDSLPTFANDSYNTRYVYVMNDIQAFQSVHAIRYRFMHSSPFTLGDSPDLYSGDMRISSPNIINITRIFTDSASFSWYDFVFGAVVFKSLADLLTADKIYVEFEWLYNLYFETSYDFSSIDDKFYFSDNEVLKSDAQKLFPYIQNLISEGYFEEGKTKTTLKNGIETVRYDVNKDFGVLNTTKVQYPLPISFDYCLSCRGHYPNRILFSDPSSQEQQSDSWRVYPPLNYTDLPANRGTLTAFDYTGGIILARAQRGLFMLQPDPQQIETSSSVIYLGTPGFLSLPPQEMARDSSGYGGQQSRFASVNAPMGFFWYDEDAGKVFAYDGKVNEISRKGMFNFFNREHKLTKSNPLANRDKTILSYDPKYERVIVHSHDVVDDQVYSFTLSYGIPVQAWVSFHSYQPDHMFYLNRNFYSTLGNKLYLHNEGDDFCEYYGIEHNFQVGITYVNMQTQQWQSIHYYAPVFKRDGNKWVDVLSKTFDKAFIFTRRQCTGLFNLLLTTEPLDIITWNERTKTVVQADRNYRIAGIRDLSTGTSIVSGDWNDISTFYQDGQGYQDIVPVNIDYEKPQYEQLMFRDKFVQARLLFLPKKHRMLIYVADFIKLAQVR